ncbi:MAG: choice-of-anchor D domain-containing protein, partial [Thermodesulfobacteriota bacterium]
LRVLVDGEEFTAAAFTVTTLGLGEFAKGLSGTAQVTNFPQPSTNTQLRWQESQQNFVVFGASEGGGGSSSIDQTRFMLENPQPASFQSGIGVISGWVCTAGRVDIEFDGAFTLQAAYGTSRADTAGVCGDEGNNGFGLLFNWNLLGDGVHTVRALADGVEFARVSFTVATLGMGEFATGLAGGTQVANFPQAGTAMRLQWEESQQNFPLAGAIPPGVNPNQCVTQSGEATDAAGATASLSWSNPCLLTVGNTMLLTINNALAGAAALRAQTDPRPFFACDTDLRIVQGNQVFDVSQFEWLDAAGRRVCQEIAPGSALRTLIRVRTGVSLNFNNPFQARYVDRPVIDFPPASPAPCRLAVSSAVLDFGDVIVGGNRDATFRVTNSGAGTLVGEASTGGDAHFSILSGGSFSLGEGQSQTVTVRFRPSDAGERAGSVSIDSNCGSALVTLSGRGVAPEPPRLAVSPDRLDFGTIPRGGSRTLDVTVTNTGGGTLEGQLSLTLEGGTTGQPAPFSLGPGASTVISVTVNVPPNTTPGPFGGTVTVTSNGGSRSIPVSGTVV